jgi:hypothetical protein
MHRNFAVLLRTSGDAILEKIMKPTLPLPPQETLVPQQYPAQYPPIERVTKPNLDTAAAAHYLNRRPQTLRGWACYENGPIRPTRINGRLAWPVQVLRGLLGGAV